MDGTSFKRVIELADVLLDPPAWSGGNTTLEGLASGKPVVTLPGEFMRGRHGLAFLTQAKMGSLIARGEDDYVRLATDRDAHARALEGADLDGPFGDLEAVRGLDAWIRRVSSE
jgi:predicted O-linked N-acetylglucosamine transferase (SPINDLY family)